MKEEDREFQRSRRKEPSLSFRLHEINRDSFLNNLNLLMVKIIYTQDSPSKIRSVQFKLELVTPQGNMINTFNSNQLENKTEGLRTFFCTKLRSRGKKTNYSRKFFQTKLSRLVVFSSTPSFIHSNSCTPRYVFITTVYDSFYWTLQPRLYSH